MKLIGSLTSPFVRKVRIVLLEKNIPHEMIIDMPWNPDTHVPDYNPLGKVPALVGDDGSVWFDSSILVEYIELNYPAAKKLFPTDPKAVLDIRHLTTLADGVGDAGVAIFLERKRNPELQDAKWIARQRDKIIRGLAMLESKLQARQWLYGESFSVADIATGTALLWFDFRLPDIEWRAQYPALKALTERLMTRESFAQTVPVG